MRSRAQTVPKNPSNTANFMRGPRQNSKNDGRLIEDWRLSLTLSPSGWQSWLSWLRLLAYLTVFATLQTLPQLIKLVSFNKFHEIYFLECSVRLWETFLATIVIPNCIHPMIMTAFLRGTPNTDHQKFIQMMFSEFYLNWNKVCHKYTLSDPQGLVVSR